jgi:hypothetical protein
VATVSQRFDPQEIRNERTALRFVVPIGILSFFAHLTYEGWRRMRGLFGASLTAYAIPALQSRRNGVASGEAIALFDAETVAVSGAGSLVLGRLHDPVRFSVLIVVTVASAWFAPLVFFSDLASARRRRQRGIAMGVHESIIPAAAAPIRPFRSARFRVRVFHSGLRGLSRHGQLGDRALHDVSRPALLAFCSVTQLGAVPMFAWGSRMYGLRSSDETLQ